MTGFVNKNPTESSDSRKMFYARWLFSRAMFSKENVF